jgi:hypothetical protein
MKKIYKDNHKIEPLLFKVTYKPKIRWFSFNKSKKQSDANVVKALNMIIDKINEFVLDYNTLKESNTNMNLIKLSVFISNDSDKYSSIEEAYILLKTQSGIDDSVAADEVVTMWYKFENHFTVRELLNEIE